MTKIDHTSFSTFSEFKSVLAKARLVFLHVFAGAPNEKLLSLLDPSLKNELLVLLDRDADAGFLASTPIVVDVSAPPRKFVTKQLIDLRGVGAFAKGAMVGFEENEQNFSAFISKSRDFAFGNENVPRS